MRINFLKHGASVLVLGLFVFLALGSGTAETAVRKEPTYKEIPLSELSQAINNVDGPGQGFIVQAELPSNIGIFPFELNYVPPSIYTDHLDWDEYAELRSRIEEGKVYTIYISVSWDSYGYGNTAYLERIDGLMTLEELANRDAQRKAEQEAADEAERLAAEEANRYDPAKFIIVPSDFKPANYAKTDLLAAAAAAEKLKTIELVENASFAELQKIIEEKGLFSSDVYYTPSKKFVSDVVFVSQNGIDITFKTSDNAITKMMKVDSRTGLTAGQKVRIYYRVYRIEGWQIHAIEKL